MFRGTIDSDLVREQWDALVRVAASLRQRTAPAHSRSNEAEELSPIGGRSRGRKRPDARVD